MFLFIIFNWIIFCNILVIEVNIFILWIFIDRGYFFGDICYEINSFYRILMCFVIIVILFFFLLYCYLG